MPAARQEEEEEVLTTLNPDCPETNRLQSELTLESVREGGREGGRGDESRGGEERSCAERLGKTREDAPYAY